MKFYNRERELQVLAEVCERSTVGARMTFIVGRRRVGKTTLIKKAYLGSKFIYLFTSKKNESLLCQEFIEVIQNEADISIHGTFKSFSALFAQLVELSKTIPFTLAIDEFQEFSNINSTVYADMQNIWDAGKQESKMNLILSGSIYSLMKKIFEGSKEPLFGRADAKINLKSFDVDTIRDIFKDYVTGYSPKDLLAFFIITGGVAKYIELFVEANAFDLDQMLNKIFSIDSLFLEEGRNVLIEEFGKEYGTYFSILSLISASKTSRSEIESILEKKIGGYLDRLEHDYNIIKRIKPILSKPNGRIQKYIIDDNFLNFWFRYIYKYRSAIELGNFIQLKEYIKKDFNTYSGRFLEKYFIQKLTLSGKFTQIGSYWERGNLNEIDIVALNEFDRTVLFAEVKLNPKKISLDKLKFKARNLIKKFRGYNITYKGFSLDDIERDFTLLSSEK